LALTRIAPGESLVAVLQRLLGAVRDLDITVTRCTWRKASATVAVLRYLRRQRLPHALPCRCARQEAAAGLFSDGKVPHAPTP